MILRAAWTGLAALALASAAGATPALSLWRLDCGRITAFDLDEFSDTRAYVGQHKELTASCYLIRHGDTYMLWDTGLPRALRNHVMDAKQPLDAALTVTIVDQLATLGIKPEQVQIVAISHDHFDHIGQAGDFPQAKLLMGKADIDTLRAPGAELGKLVAHWLTGGGTIEPITGDKDIFGDGSVVMLAMPGHTPGHHALLVKLAHKGNVLLSGDTAHFAKNYASNGVPSYNADRADTLASLDRFKKLAANLHATVIIQHEPADVAKLPAFPKAAD
ncbi:N-acyl homoserine lactonase family protein [Sphingomonas crusticola]|uniref:N-acyl homoserine lactonase family protein n=1 Tax=Sphingomonas crusticola TaxID=1697973 RepID=UPI000E27889B|nr:N-acyl homoserine lactonase family protein [Sphingomonas crusticola]